jgi:hypothetical protein
LTILPDPPVSDDPPSPTCERCGQRRAEAPPEVQPAWRFACARCAVDHPGWYLTVAQTRKAAREHDLLRDALAAALSTQPSPPPPSSAASPTAPPEPTTDLVEQRCREIEHAYQSYRAEVRRKVTWADIAAQVGYSASYLRHCWKRRRGGWPPDGSKRAAC